MCINLLALARSFNAADYSPFLLFCTLNPVSSPVPWHTPYPKCSYPLSPVPTVACSYVQPTGVHEGHQVDKKDYVRGRTRSPSADPHVAYHRQAPRPILQLQDSFRWADGQLPQPPWAAPQVSLEGRDSYVICLCARLLTHMMSEN